MHPYSVAKMVSTLGYLYGRTVYLNMVAGGFKSDLSALDDLTPHDLRYSSSSVPTLVEQKELVIGSEVIFTHRDLCK
jgi:alkanesulfonate monooxygenase